MSDKNTMAKAMRKKKTKKRNIEQKMQGTRLLGFFKLRNNNRCPLKNNTIENVLTWSARISAFNVKIMLLFN